MTIGPRSSRHPQDQATPLILIRDSYESTMLTSFFYLLLTYLSPNSDEQKAIFLQFGLSRSRRRQPRKSRRRNLDISPEMQLVRDEGKGPGDLQRHRSLGQPGNAASRWENEKLPPPPRTRWIFPLGWIRWKPKDGLHFLWMMKWGVLQYCVIRPT